MIRVTGDNTKFVFILGTQLLISIQETQASPPVLITDIQWIYTSLNNNPTILDTPLLSNDHLTFTKTVSMLSDEGNYTVRVRNPAGIAVITIQIIIEGIRIMLFL